MSSGKYKRRKKQWRQKLRVGNVQQKIGKFDKIREIDIEDLLGLAKMKKSTKFKNMEKEGRENKNTK